MSNTPTESEFDKELDHIMGCCSGVSHSPCWYDENITGKDLSDYEEAMLIRVAIKQAVDKHVKCKHEKVRDLASLVRQEQHKALYGGR